MTAVEAMEQAEAEGLTLARSDKPCGFRHVHVNINSKAKPCEVKVWRDGKQVFLGCFATAEEAALHHARTPEAQAVMLEATARAAAAKVNQARIMDARDKAQATAQATALRQAQAQAQAEAKLAAKAEAVRARQG